jgi:hypothetical protein
MGHNQHRIPGSADLPSHIVDKPIEALKNLMERFSSHRSPIHAALLRSGIEKPIGIKL